MKANTNKPKTQMQSTNIVHLTDQELEGIAGGLEWGVGFLGYLNPVAVLGFVGYATYSLISNYSSYTAGVSQGYDYAAVQ